MQVLFTVEGKMRTINIVIGSKAYFQEQIKDFSDAVAFLDLIKLSDSYLGKKQVFPDELKAKLMILRNDNYHGITEQANDRLGNLIYDLTTDDSTIWIHNPPSNLLFFLSNQKNASEITLNTTTQTHDIVRDSAKYIEGIASIKENIIGQNHAIVEISKTLRYLTTVKRKKPYVVMLYGNSSIGKTELVREIAKKFFGNQLLEQHLSMFKSNANGDYLFGDKPNRRSIGFDLLERESNLVFLDEFDKCADFFYSVFYTLFDNTVFKDAVYEVDVSGILIILTSNYVSEDEMKERLGLPIFYRIDKFVHFEDFDSATIHKIVCKELDDRFEEYKDYFSKDELYAIVSKRILTTGENARTIKNKIQTVLEELLFEKFLENGSTDTYSLNFIEKV